jgi:ribosomal subunit interface protein
VGSKTRSAGRVLPKSVQKGVPAVDIIFRGRHTDVLGRFRRHAAEKLARIGRLDQKAIRVDVEVSAERNPRQSERRERVELTISSRGPAIRAEAAAGDRYAALDLAIAKLESRLRRACDRRKGKHGAHAAARQAGPPVEGGAHAAARQAGPPVEGGGADDGLEARAAAPDHDPAASGATPDDTPAPEELVPVQMEGDGPLVVREKCHAADPMAIDQALFEMELVGHDFFLFRDVKDGRPSVVYRRRGYQYGVIRLEDASAWEGRPQVPAARGAADGQARRAAQLAKG